MCRTVKDWKKKEIRGSIEGERNVWVKARKRKYIMKIRGQYAKTEKK